MKVTHDNNKNVFRPVTISITCESQTELNALGTLFNTAMICDSLEKVFGIRIGIYDDFRNAGADINSKVSALANQLRKS